MGSPGEIGTRAGAFVPRGVAARALAALERNAVPLAVLALSVLFASLARTLHIKDDITAVVLGGAALVLAGTLLRRLRFDVGTQVILLAGLVLYFLYLSYTTFGERNYDGPEQLKYIEYIAKNHAIPPSKHCFICHHPPLYYVVGAVFHRFFDLTRLAPNPFAVQLVSLGMFFAFLVYGALFARLFSDDSRTVRIATAILVFWPYSFHNSVRIHNDTLVATLVAGGMYYTARWWQEERPRHLYLAALFSALGVLTKSTAYVVPATFGLLLVWRFFTRPDKLRLLRRGTFAVAIVVAAYGALQLRAPVGEDRCHRMLGTACDIAARDFTGNKPINYVFFDVPKFLREPYMVIANDSSGKQFFWNHVLKSSLFGTHNKIPDRETAYALNRSLAWLMNAGLFGMVIYAAIGGLAGARRIRRYAVPLLFLALSSAFLMVFKIIIPAPHHTDFRHIFFVLVPGALLFAAALRHLDGRARVLGALGKLLYVPFLVLSVIYFLPKYELVMQYTKSTVEKPLASVRKIVPEAAPWDKDGNLIIEGNETVVFTTETPLRVTKIDVSLDGNDIYEIKLFGDGPPRVIVVRPKKNFKIGLGRYNLPIEPHMENVTRVSVRPLGGDRTYSLGHLLLQ